MNKHYGVILLEINELIFRIYETTDHEWKLFYYYSSLIPSSPAVDTSTLVEIIGNFFITPYAEHIAEWKMCSRNHPKKIIEELSQAIDIPIEDISLHREQELICKGMFTELW